MKMLLTRLPVVNHISSGWDHSVMVRALEIMASFEIGQTVS